MKSLAGWELSFEEIKAFQKNRLKTISEESSLKQLKRNPWILKKKFELSLAGQPEIFHLVQITNSLEGSSIFLSFQFTFSSYFLRNVCQFSLKLFSRFVVNFPTVKWNSNFKSLQRLSRHLFSRRFQWKNIKLSQENLGLNWILSQMLSF